MSKGLKIDSRVNFVNPDNEDKSVKMPSNSSVVNFVNPDNEDKSVKPPTNSSVVNFVNPDNEDKSGKGPCSAASDVRFVAFSNPVRSLTLVALSEVNVFISASVTAAFQARFAPRASLIWERRMESGMFTFAAATGGAPASSTTPTIRQNIISFVIKCSQSFIKNSP